MPMPWPQPWPLTTYVGLSGAAACELPHPARTRSARTAAARDMANGFIGSFPSPLDAELFPRFGTNLAWRPWIRDEMASAPDILPPRYRDPTPIGAGGMASVYRAVDEALGRTVAVKVLGEGQAHDSDLRARFTRE